MLPLHRNFATPNPGFDWDNLPVGVVSQSLPWRRGTRPRRAGVSAFGFSGTNVHLLLEEAPVPAVPTTVELSGRECLFVLSARSEPALRELAARYATFVDGSHATLEDICRSAALGRAHLRYRLAAVVRSREELAGALNAWCAGSGTAVRTGLGEQPAPRIGFFCPPLAPSDAAAVTRALAAAIPAFATIWADFAAAVAPEALDGPAADFDPAQAVVLQYVLGRFLNALGANAATALGVGSGEIAAASLAGLLSPADTLARARARLTAPAKPAKNAGCVGSFISTRTGRGESVWDDRLQDPRARSRLDEAGRAAVVAGVDSLLVLGTDASAAPSVIQRQVTVLSPSAEDAWRSLLDMLATLYLADTGICWSALYQERPGSPARPKLDLPIYAFQRHSFWRPQARAHLPQGPSAGASWSKVVTSVQLQSESGPLGWNVASYPVRWERFDELAAGHAAKTLVELGEFASAGARASADDVVRRHAIVPLYRGLLHRWMQLLVRQGLLRSEDDAFVSVQPLREPDLAPVWRDIERLVADDPDFLEYVRRTSGKLKELLTGRVKPLELLFPGGSLEMAEGIYERSASARYLNSMAAAAVRSAIEDHRGGEPFRLVEAGAGTGGTTSRLAEFFPPDGEYWFTDVSDVFLGRARRRYGKSPAFRFAKFNLDLPPTAELPVGASDVVLAANVVHATRDVGTTIRNLRRLLKPGGLLVLIESTLHHSAFDLTIAFIEGWSSFEDKYRAIHPLLSADRWTALLGECGFVAAERFPISGAAADSVGQHIVLGRNGLDAPAATVAGAVERRAAEVPAGVSSSVTSPALTGTASQQVRRAELEKFVRTCAARIMRLDPATRPAPRERFSDLGMDSLMALQFKSDLAKGLGLGDRLSSTIAFDTGTVERLTDELLRLTDADADAGAAPPASASSAPPAAGSEVPGAIGAAALEQFSDDQVEELLAQRVLANQEILER